MSSSWPRDRSSKPIVREFTCGQSLDVPTRSATHLIVLRAEPHQFMYDALPKISWVDFEIYEIVGIDSNGVLLFKFDDDFVTSTDAAAPQLHGFVKWDGCTQWWTPEESEPLHVDYPSSIKEMFDALVETRRFALVEIMKQESDA